jgi:hypothetical protein
MSENTEMIQDGLLCDVCGGFNGVEKIKSQGGEFNGDVITKTPGHPITCTDCKREEKRRKYSKKGKR